MKKILYVALASACAMSLAPAADAQRVRSTGVGGAVASLAADPADSLYAAARSALNDGDYRRAATLFQQVTEKFPRSAVAGDALYWRAWSLYRSGNGSRSKGDLDEALVALDRYTSGTEAKGKQAGDAADLRARIRNAQAALGDASAAGDIAEQTTKLRRQSACTGSTADEEMRMAALDGLLSMSSENAVPILKDVLKQRDSCRVDLRRKAVWLISQKSATDVVPALLDVVRSDPSTDVRGEAIFWLSQAHSGLAIPALDSILSSPTADIELRKKSIFALSQQTDEGARTAIRRAAEDERMPEEIRDEAVFWLGNEKMANLEYFRTLFHKTKSEELRRKVLFAVNQSSSPDATAWLLDVAKDKTFDVDTRKEAVFWAGQRPSVNLDQLESVYAQSKGDDEMQKQVLFVYSQRREAAAVDKLMAVAKSDPNIEMRKQALFWLGQKNDPRVRQFIRDLISK